MIPHYDWWDVGLRCGVECHASRFFGLPIGPLVMFLLTFVVLMGVAKVLTR